MENIGQLGLQPEEGTNESQGCFDSGPCMLKEPRPNAEPPIEEELHQQQGIIVEAGQQPQPMDFLLAPPTVLDKLITIMEDLDSRMTKLEATNEEILGLMKLYDLLNFKPSSSHLDRQDHCSPRETKDGQTQTTGHDGSMSKKNVASSEQSQQTCELSIGPSFSARDKGKGHLDLHNLNVIVPNSDDEDDVFVNESLSTPKICTSMSISVGDAYTESCWVSGKPKNVKQATQLGSASAYTQWSKDADAELNPSKSPIGRNLFMTPSPAKRTPKRPRAQGTSNTEGWGGKDPTPHHSVRSTMPQTRLGRKAPRPTPKPPAALIPKSFRTYFRPTPEMGLSKNDCQIAMFLFGADLDVSELLFTYGNVYIPRAVFLSVCPGRTPHQDIINCMALKTTLLQKHGPLITTWCFPTSFADDVLSGLHLNQLMDRYANTWMPSTLFLQHVYVPLFELGGHCYLMVISFKDQKIFSLDTFPSEDKIADRRKNMLIVCGILSQMIALPQFVNHFLNDPPNLSTWEIIHCMGIPNRGNSNDAAVWIMAWLDMEYAFTSNLPGVINDPRVRMTSAIKLVCAAINEQRTYVEGRA